MEMSGHLSPGGGSTGGDVMSPLSWWRFHWWRCLVTSQLVEMSGHPSTGGDVWSPLNWWRFYWWRCLVTSLLVEMSGHLSPGGDVWSPLSWWRCLVTSLLVEILLVEMSGHLSPGGDVRSSLSWWRCLVTSLLVEILLVVLISSPLSWWVLKALDFVCVFLFFFCRCREYVRRLMIRVKYWRNALSHLCCILGPNRQ